MKDNNKAKSTKGIKRDNASCLSEAEIRYSAVFEQSPDGILIIDTEGKILDFNRAAHTDLGYTREEFSKFSIPDIDPVESPEEIRAHIQMMIAAKKAEFEVSHRTKSGEYRNVLVITQTIELSGRTVLHAIWRDITDQKAAEKAILESEAKYRDLFENASDAVFVLDPELRYADVNRRGLELLGYTREELLGRQPFDFVPAEQRRQSADEFAKLKRTGSYETFEGRMRTKDGQWIAIEVSSTAMFKDGVFAGSRDIVRDITMRKQAEETLAANQKFLDTVFESAPACIKLITADGTLQLMNRAGLDMIEADSLEQVKGKCLYPLVSEEHREAFHNSIQAVFRGESRALEFRMIGLKGRPLWLFTHSVPLRNEKGEIVLALATTIDITERKRANEALSHSEERYRSIFEDSPISMWEEDFSDLQEHIDALRSSGVTDFRSYCADHPEEVYKCVGLVRIISVNKATLVLYEAHDQSALLKDLSRVFTAQSFDSFREIILALAEGKKTYECEAVNQTLTGRKLNVLLRWSLLSEVADHGYRALVSVVDITARKDIEEKLRQSEAFVRNILDTVDEGFIVIDRDFRILTANRAYCSQVGEPCASVIGRHCYEVSHKTLRPCHEEGEECAVLHVFKTGEPHTALHKHPDAKGSVLYVETKAFPIKDSTGAVISVIETVNNITEKHLLEEEQLKTQKLEAIGTLAGGIAHDFNNLLQGVFGYISMAKLTLDQKERSLTMLEQAEKALHMSVSLTTQLLTFSRGGKPVKRKILLKSVIENSVRFALSGSRVDFHIKFEEDLWSVDADEGQLGQVVQNIVLNADQAMPLGGTIKISGRNVCAGDKGIPAGLTEGNYVEISVKDNGIGIPEQHLPRLFDPYFTTKEKGSGLGLATSYSIIKNHGGLIDVKSELGKGSAFFVYLPAAGAEEESAGTITVTAEAARKGRVLVMDDEELIRNIVGIMLRALEHEVEFAENGEEAIAKYREAMSSGRRFDIVILDLTIRGGKGGEEAIQELLAIDPEVKAVVSSGYSDSATISEYGSLGFSACLTKPYELDALRDILNKLLK